MADRDEVPIAHAAVVERMLKVGDQELRTGYVEGVATAQKYQGRGTLVMQHAGSIIRAGFEVGALSTGVPDFFIRLGWESWNGPTFAIESSSNRVRTADEDAGILILRTPQTQDLDTAAELTCDWRSGDSW